MKISYQQVEQNIANIANRSIYTKDFLYELLAAYGRSASAITQLRQGVLNKGIDGDSVLQKDVVYFKTYQAGTELIEKVVELENDPLSERYQPRYLIATDLTSIAAKDTKKGTTLSIKIADIDQQIAFFYGWTGDEITDDKTEAVADRRAADKMKELYAEIEKENLAKFAEKDNTFRHDLNVFFSRLLFCFFAEDTDIFNKKQFSYAVKTFTSIDGSDLGLFFANLFKSLDSEVKVGISTPFSDFPYINGTIFDTSRHTIAFPDFNAQARHLILECAKSNWSEINPDIFGTLFQSIVDPHKREEGGMDYTSVPNILKVIEPLFLEDLHELFDTSYEDKNKLWKLYNRISKIKIFDPACGSGNFLIISYKELRKLENAILQRISDLSPGGLGNIKINSNIKLENFYGIEIDDFAHEIATLSLYLAAHQMNIDFEKQFGKKLSIVPLIDIPTIICGNAARLDWQEICPNVGFAPSKVEQNALFDLEEPEQQELPIEEKIYDEIYLVGNPPYKGSRVQEKSQKHDIKEVFEGVTTHYKDMDYIGIWFYKGAQYISGTKARLSFVSTNSVTQGMQIELIWPLIYQQNCEIIFAYTSFKWSNGARDQSGVTCVIVGLTDKRHSVSIKYIFANSTAQRVAHINSYLNDGPDIIVGRLNKPLCKEFPKMQFGNMAIDEGNFFFTALQKDELLSRQPALKPYIRRVYGSYEYLNAVERYCLWINDSEVDTASQIVEVRDIAEKVREFRSKSKDASTRKMANRPYQFREMHMSETQTIILPRVSSERRLYIPFGYLESEDVVSDSAQALYDAPSWLFAILESKMHMAWVRTVCGQLETRIRYSSTIGYNTFPVPPLSDKQRERLSQSARKILLTRENHSEKTLSEMYDPDKMPFDLREAHYENDIVVDQLYRKKGFASDDDRLVVLFDLYEKMTKRSRSQNT